MDNVVLTQVAKDDLIAAVVCWVYDDEFGGTRDQAARIFNELGMIEAARLISHPLGAGKIRYAEIRRLRRWS